MSSLRAVVPCMQQLPTSLAGHSFCRRKVLKEQGIFLSHLGSDPASQCLRTAMQVFVEEDGSEELEGVAVAERGGLDEKKIVAEDEVFGDLEHASSLATRVVDFPPVFLRFLEQNGLDPAIYRAAHSLPRYVRLRAQSFGDIPSIEEELRVKMSPVEWLEGFFCLPADTRLAGSKAYQLGKVFGMDVASGAAVAALGISPGDHVLDLCAAPGAKLCMIAELLGVSGTLTAVDIAAPRLAACRTMLQKYEIGSNCRLFLCDGTVFSLLPTKIPLTGSSQIQASNAEENASNLCENFIFVQACGLTLPDTRRGSVLAEWTGRKTKKQKRAARRGKLFGMVADGIPELFFYGKESGVVGMSLDDILLKTLGEGNDSCLGYDKVLVDAECTHDGSLKHILKYDEWGWDTFERRFLNFDRVSSITRLQLRLLTNGFRLLRPGGTLVYSTCSLTDSQNEGVVERFLSTQPLAELQMVDISKTWPCKSGRIPFTLRFDPSTSNTSGLFIAKILKIA